jgi:hypothetical protein
MRLDYQSTPGSGEHGVLMQDYHVRFVDRLFYKNQLSFLGAFQYRGRQGSQLAQFHPRYEWLLSSYGYGGQLVYEPYTQRQLGRANEEVNRRWRAAFFIQPERWPRFTCDFLRSHRRTESESGRERWDSYSLAWQPGSSALAAGYSRQMTTAQGAYGQLVEVYRASATTMRSAPWRHRLSLGYSFERTWNNRAAAQTGSQDQHAGTISIDGAPAASFNWSSQYNGRFLVVKRPGATVERPTDHLATATVNWIPAKVLSVSASRYIERAGARADQSAQRTDYWQGRATAEGKLYRQMRVLATAYRIVYSGAPKGERYNDAYFLALRGKPFRHADWSAELSLGDRHGRQPERYAGNVNIYTRLEPLFNVQMQIGYTALLSAIDLDAFRITEESYNTNVQYLPSNNMSLSGTWSVRRNHPLSSQWNAAWSVTGTYRWPAFASVSFNYSERQMLTGGGATTLKTAAQPATLLASFMWWVGLRSTVNGQYMHQTTGNGVTSDNWGVGISTSF